ncbi:MAG: hypothetical protein IPN90_00740 [Elusimicrobia bacterium]|nr:hypothetical protein [Elusimicrobiota bacterium]
MDRSAAATAVGEGGAFLSGLDSLGSNPAGLSGAKREWNATYRQMPLDTRLNGTALSWPLQPIHTTIAISYTTLRSEGLERRTESGEHAGEFNHEDQMVGLHAAHSFVMRDIEIAGGASVKGIQSRIDRYNGTGLAIDLGFRHRIKGVPLTLAATALNLGQGPKLLTDRSALPTSFGLSASYQALSTFAVIGGGSYQTQQDLMNISLGADYRIGISLRCGDTTWRKPERRDNRDWVNWSAESESSWASFVWITPSNPQGKIWLTRELPPPNTRH